jgi:hypothetical protein
MSSNAPLRTSSGASSARRTLAADLDDKPSAWNSWSRPSAAK